MTLTVGYLANLGVAGKSEEDVKNALDDIKEGGFKRSLANNKTGGDQQTTETTNSYEAYLAKSGKTHEEAMDDLKADSDNPKYAGMEVDDYFNNKTEGLKQDTPPALAKNTPDTQEQTAPPSENNDDTAEAESVAESSPDNNKLFDLISQFAQGGAAGISCAGGGSLIQSVCAKFGIDLPPEMIDFCNDLGEKIGLPTQENGQPAPGQNGQDLIADAQQPNIGMDNPATPTMMG